MIKHLEKQEDFEKEIKGNIVVDFYADWCGPCKMVGRILEEINSFDVLKINVDEFPDIAREFGVMSIPTLIKFTDGKEVKKIIGLRNKEELENEFK